jgi:hypothetical protein
MDAFDKRLRRKLTHVSVPVLADPSPRDRTDRFRRAFVATSSRDAARCPWGSLLSLLPATAAPFVQPSFCSVLPTRPKVLNNDAAGATQRQALPGAQRGRRTLAPTSEPSFYLNILWRPTLNAPASCAYMGDNGGHLPTDLTSRKHCVRSGSRPGTRAAIQLDSPRTFRCSPHVLRPQEVDFLSSRVRP